MRRFTIPVSLALLLAMVAGPATAAGPTTIRPISDWLEQQAPDLDPSVPLELQMIVWYDPAADNFLLADHSGIAARWLAMNGGPSVMPDIRGHVIERPLPDGRAQVTVQLRATGALTYVWHAPDLENFHEGPMLFGHRADEILDGAEPTLGSLHLKLTFINTEPGAPLPDYVAFAFDDDFREERQLDDWMDLFSGHAFGPLREASGFAEGTRGRAATQQVGLWHPPGGGKVADVFVVEWIKLQARGGR
jgi:hypothetical protein